MARYTYAFSNGDYNDWHRKYDGIAMIDIDSIECCPRCYEPLAIIETCYDKNQKYKFYFKERPIAYFLGVFQKLNSNIFFSILTRQASKSGQKIHIRCPQIIAIKSQVKNWFKGEGDWLKESYNDINNEDLFELGLKYEKN